MPCRPELVVGFDVVHLQAVLIRRHCGSAEVEADHGDLSIRSDVWW